MFNYLDLYSHRFVGCCSNLTHQAKNFIFFALLSSAFSAHAVLQCVPSASGWHLWTIHAPYPTSTSILYPTPEAACAAFPHPANVSVQTLPPYINIVGQTGQCNFIYHDPTGYGYGYYPSFIFGHVCPIVPAGERDFAYNTTTLRCERDVNYSPALSTGTCSPEQFNLTLNSASGDIEPSGTKALSVQVVNSVTHAPKADAKVRVTLDVQSGSGGHEHHDASRPKGSLTGCAPAGNGVYECITGADGLANFNFNASIVSGTHSVNAACSNLTCVNQPSPVTVDVKVAGLLPIPASQFYSLTEPIGGGGFKSVGASDSHHNNHYLTATASNELWRITAQYHFEQRFKLAGNIAPPVWYLNDASLAWGGVFDIKNNWSKPHVEHRRGGSIDVRANGASFGSIPDANITKVRDLLAGTTGIGFLLECTLDKQATPPSQRHNRVKPTCVSQLDGSRDMNRHFHLRLTGAQ